MSGRRGGCATGAARRWPGRSIHDDAHQRGRDRRVACAAARRAARLPTGCPWRSARHAGHRSLLSTGSASGVRRRHGPPAASTIWSRWLIGSTPSSHRNRPSASAHTIWSTSGGAGQPRASQTWGMPRSRPSRSVKWCSGTGSRRYSPPPNRARPNRRAAEVRAACSGSRGRARRARRRARARPARPRVDLGCSRRSSRCTPGGAGRRARWCRRCRGGGSHPRRWRRTGLGGGGWSCHHPIATV